MPSLVNPFAERQTVRKAVLEYLGNQFAISTASAQPRRQPSRVALVELVEGGPVATRDHARQPLIARRVLISHTRMNAYRAIAVFKPCH